MELVPRYSMIVYKKVLESCVNIHALFHTNEDDQMLHISFKSKNTLANQKKIQRLHPLSNTFSGLWTKLFLFCFVFLLFKTDK